MTPNPTDAATQHWLDHRVQVHTDDGSRCDGYCDSFRPHDTRHECDLADGCPYTDEARHSSEYEGDDREF